MSVSEYLPDVVATGRAELPSAPVAVVLAAKQSVRSEEASMVGGMIHRIQVQMEHEGAEDEAEVDVKEKDVALVVVVQVLRGHGLSKEHRKRGRQVRRAA
jgi:hypothetical protein